MFITHVSLFLDLRFACRGRGDAGPSHAHGPTAAPRATRAALAPALGHRPHRRSRRCTRGVARLLVLRPRPSHYALSMATLYTIHYTALSLAWLSPQRSHHGILYTIRDPPPPRTARSPAVPPPPTHELPPRRTPPPGRWLPCPPRYPRTRPRPHRYCAHPACPHGYCARRPPWYCTRRPPRGIGIGPLRSGVASRRIRLARVAAGASG